MNSLICATDYVLPDEPCLGVFEVIRSILGKQHRVQIIQIVRNDKVVTLDRDLGSIKKFPDVDLFRIPGGIIEPSGKIHTVHTAGQLMEIADTLREKNILDKVDRVLSGTKTKRTGTNR